MATITRTSGASAEDVAGYIARTVNDSETKRDLLRDAMAALSDLMAEGLNFSTEQAAENVVTRIAKSLL